MDHSDNHINIIVADDSKEFLEGLLFLLSENEKYRVTDVAKDGEQLLTSPHLKDADLILTDIEMPKMNGIEVVKRINYDFPDIKFIAITMYIDQLYLFDIVSAGFKAFLHKPEIPENLFNTIELVMKDEYVFPDRLKFER